MTGCCQHGTGTVTETGYGAVPSCELYSRSNMFLLQISVQVDLSQSVSIIRLPPLHKKQQSYHCVPNVTTKRLQPAALSHTPDLQSVVLCAFVEVSGCIPYTYAITALCLLLSVKFQAWGGCSAPQTAGMGLTIHTMHSARVITPDAQQLVRQDVLWWQALLLCYRA